MTPEQKSEFSRLLSDYHDAEMRVVKVVGVVAYVERLELEARLDGASQVYRVWQVAHQAVGIGYPGDHEAKAYVAGLRDQLEKIKGEG